MKNQTIKTPGTSPGSAIYIGNRRDVSFSVEKIVFNEERIQRNMYQNVPPISDLTGYSDQKTWINVSGLHHAEKVSEIAKGYGLHPLVIEDILNSRQHPKAEFFDDYIVVILKVLTLDSSERLINNQISIIFTKDTILTFSDSEIDIFKPVLDRIDNGKGLIRSQPPCYLAWALLDTIVDHYLLLIEILEEQISALDESVFESIDVIDSRELFQSKKKVSDIYRQIRPVREIVYQIQRSEWEHLSPKSLPFYRDLYGHIVDALDNIDHLRDQTASLRDFYLASISNRMNEIMKVLTCFSAIFLPLTFLAGIYGMNFEFIPELKWKYSYPLIWVVFIVLTTGMIYFFKRRRWL